MGLSEVELLYICYEHNRTIDKLASEAVNHEKGTRWMKMALLSITRILREEEVGVAWDGVVN